MKRLIVALTLALTFCAVPAFAQLVVNPTRVEFTASTDHADIVSYDLGYFAPGATDPVQVVNLGKPTPDGANLCTSAVNVRPLGWVQNFIVKVRAVASPTVMSEWSDASNPFSRMPGKPGGPVIK
jgi:hypothetical protein